MARELFDTEPVFAETVTRCADAVSEILPHPLLEVVFATDRETGGAAGERLRHTSFAQPALFAVEMGLARLWQSWGSNPMWCWGTAWASTRRHAWRVSSASRTAPG